MRTFAALTAAALFAATAPADDKKDDKTKGTVVELAGKKSTAPADWKESDKPGSMRLTQFAVPKADGDKEDADVSIFYFKGKAGTIEQNLQRQRDKFKPADGKDKVEEKLDKTKVGTTEATYQDLKGTFQKKPFPMAEKATPMAGWRQLYVAFETDDGQYYLRLLGPEKTVEKQKKAFEEWLKNFK